MPTIYTPSLPLVVGVTYTFPVPLTSQSDTKLFKTSPTLEAGDFILYRKVAGVWSRVGSLTTLPALIGIGTRVLLFTVLNTELIAGTQAIGIECSDAAGAQWCDIFIYKDVDTAETVSSLTQAQILSDATPFAGAFIDVAISSRAASGASDPLSNTVPGAYANGTAGYALGKIGTGKIQTAYPLTADGAVTTIQGCDYLAADGWALDWTDTDNLWPVLTGAAITVIINDVAQFTGSVITATGTNKKVRLQLTKTQSRTITASKDMSYRVLATLTGTSVIPLVESTEGYGWTSKREYDLV